jgi:putative hydrolase of the HAD superfamily
MKSALLFDLDETLVVEERAIEEAFLTTSGFAAARYAVDSKALAVSARARARELWYAGPAHDYCLRVGISSWEGLWCRFNGDGDEVGLLRDWSRSYRQSTWTLALADHDIEDKALAEELAARFGDERRRRHRTFADARNTIPKLAASYTLGLVTNGASCLQREKLAASGLAGYFTAIVVSADLGVAKPDPSVFEHAVGLLGAKTEATTMVGDSIEKDAVGARAAGLGAVWVNRSNAPQPEIRDLESVNSLEGLPIILGNPG